MAGRAGGCQRMTSQAKSVGSVFSASPSTSRGCRYRKFHTSRSFSASVRPPARSLAIRTYTTSADTGNSSTDHHGENPTTHSTVAPVTVTVAPIAAAGSAAFHCTPLIALRDRSPR